MANEAYKRLRDLLVDARKSAGLTQTDLALRMNRPQSFISKYERGERRLDVIEFGEVAAALGISPAKLLSNFYTVENDR